MKLTAMGRNTRKPPLRTVSEIAEMLGISTQQLMWALKDADAPAPSMKAAQASHCVTGNNKVWYEPKSVVRWYRSRPADFAADKRREYHRKYYRENYSVAAKKEAT